ncbi:MAG: hypothetical protein V4463_01960 [Pseudomonadota bacterium]
MEMAIFTSFSNYFEIISKIFQKDVNRQEAHTLLDTDSSESFFLTKRNFKMSKIIAALVASLFAASAFAASASASASASAMASAPSASASASMSASASAPAKKAHKAKAASASASGSASASAASAAASK